MLNQKDTETTKRTEEREVPMEIDSKPKTSHLLPMRSEDLAHISPPIQPKKPDMTPIPAASIPQRIRMQIDEQLDFKMTELKHSISQQVSDMQIDMIRQFMQQEN